MTKYCVLFIKNGTEHKTSWFDSKEQAHEVFEIIKSEGCEAIIYVA